MNKESDTVQIPGYKSYKLVWNDEFNEDGKPGAHWNYEKGFVRNQELQWYQSENARVKDGVLIISGKREKIKNLNYDSQSSDWKKNREYAEYTSSCLTTSDSFNFRYGRMEVKAKIPTASGAWPAIWTLGNLMPWPYNGEIDIMEFYRRSEPIILANACWGGDNEKVSWDESTTPYANFLASDKTWAEQFHIWRMDWDKDFIKLYLDGQLLNEVDLSQTENKGNNEYAVNPFSNDLKGFGHYILLNLAIGGNGGTPDLSAFPLEYLIDYVRVYQKIDK